MNFNFFVQVSKLIVLPLLFVIFYKNAQGIELKIQPNDPWNILKQKLADNLSSEETEKAEKLLKTHLDHLQEDFNIPLVDKFELTYDFIIIGSGPGGSVMANRLSEVKNWKILLLEAGEQETPLTDVPLLSSVLHESTFDWNYKVEPQTRCCLNLGGHCKYPRGKALGGTSVINGMMYVRGNRRDNNNWQDLGNLGWGYDEILHYFKKSEDIQIKELLNSPYHGKGGYLTIEYSNYKSSIDDLLLEAGREMGLFENDNNGANQTGITRPQVFHRNGSRCSANKAFLRPAASRPNLFISTGAFVTKIHIDPKTRKAYGVTFTKNGSKYTVKANKEIILSAGTIISPKLLMLSGIGPEDHLQNIGIEVIQNLPVGKMLKDHYATPTLRFDIDSEFEVDIGVLTSTEHVNNYFKKGLGPLTLPDGMNILASLKTKLADSDKTYPDVEIFFRVANLYQDINKTKIRDSYYAEAMLFHPKSSGSIQLNSKNPEEDPKIDPNCFADFEDIAVLVEALKLIVSISKTKILQQCNVTLQLDENAECDQFVKETDEYWKCFLKNSRSADHQTGTCKMGPKNDTTSVVDPNTLKPHGIESLRIVDASVIPISPTGHTTAMVYMIAEKAADLVKTDWL